MLDSHFVIFDVLRFTPIDFPAELWALQGGFVDPFLTFIFRLILILNAKLNF